MDSRPHIVHVLGTLSAGGAQRMVLRLASSPELREYRHSVVCIISPQGEFRGQFAEKGIPVHACPQLWPESTPFPSYRLNRWLRHNLAFTFPWRFAGLLRRLHADLVHTHVTTPQIHLQSRGVLRLAHLPWVWTLHGLYRSRGEDASTWPQALGTVERSPAGALTAVSSAALEEALGLQRLPSHKVLIIPNGIDPAEYSPSLLPGQGLRTSLGIPENALVFGTAGRLIPVKRMDIFIDAARLVLKEGSAAHFLIAGEGPLREQLEQRICSQGLQDYVRLVGFQQDMHTFLGSLDAFVLASDSEGLPNALLEACAVGLPCIGTDVGGVPDILGQGAGILIEPGSPDLMAQAMHQMLPIKTRKAYAARARLTAANYTSETMCDRYSALYQDLLHRSKRD